MGIECLRNDQQNYYIEDGGIAMAKRTDEQKDAQNAYMEKLQDIKIRVPKEYFDKIKKYAKSKGLSINKLVISLLEKEIGERILSIREKNKLQKEENKTE